MRLFNRAIRIFLWVFALVSAVIIAAASLVMRYMLNPPRSPIWASPKDAGLKFSEIHFPARDDGVRLSGWLVKERGAEGQRPTIVLVHDWGWNRLGTAAEGPLADLLRTAPVDLLRLAHALTEAGYHVLMFDLRSHGESAAGSGMSFGYQESLDLLGAFDYLADREDVSSIGVIGFAVGANAILYALARASEAISVQAAVVVQPFNPQNYMKGLTRDVVGPLSQAIVPVVNAGAAWFGVAPPAAINPLFAAAGIDDVPLLFMQESGDSWSDIDYVETLAASTPGTVDLVITTAGDHRYDGFTYLINHPTPAIDFFNRHLK